LAEAILELFRIEKDGMDFLYRKEFHRQKIVNGV
jgi:hypothetical protein